MAVWRRNTFNTYTITSGFNWEDAIAAGDTYLRVHLRWGFYLDCPTTIDLQAVAANTVTWGLCTTIGNGAEARPNARSGSADQSPPTQRWIYWETRSPVVSAISQEAGIVAWRDSGSSEPSSTKGQVAAVSIPAGDSLNLSSCWASVGAYDSQVNTMLWSSLSILKKS
jgi:hypothetical protein